MLSTYKQRRVCIHQQRKKKKKKTSENKKWQFQLLLTTTLHGKIDGRVEERAKILEEQGTAVVIMA